MVHKTELPVRTFFELEIQELSVHTNEGNVISMTKYDFDGFLRKLSLFINWKRTTVVGIKCVYQQGIITNTLHMFVEYNFVFFSNNLPCNH